MPDRRPCGRRGEKAGAGLRTRLGQSLAARLSGRELQSDSRTREFFKAQIGPDFHFTYHVNQYRLANAGLTYGDLIDEWLAERDRRDTEGYKPTIAKHGEYNQFVRDYFADRANAGRTMRDAAAAWNAIKPTRDRRYKKRRGKKNK